MKESENTIRKCAKDLIARGKDRHTVLHALNTVYIEFLGVLAEERKTGRES